ncbi:hypothetical protein BCR34DRAFT_628796 [Clohesyomyces aquaticus]|uniref:DUF6594 domain-containing protein n=1 Tax=Clohesyomyces aquaticus TaxID=1231657 RepID=A0A1Y1YFC2_9PLEO|nr:hypothetical protein BCR34DRAFT_628796 [Clohesyomyces aquaticus]
MASRLSLPIEKETCPMTQPTRLSSTSSATLYSKYSMKSFILATRRFSTFRFKNKVGDVEQQSGSAQSLDSGSIFITGGKDNTKVRQRECYTFRCPIGYPRLAAFNASEQNFMQYRGFSYIHNRLLLRLQANIQALEAELEEIDQFHDSLDDAKTRLRSQDLDNAACRNEKKNGERTREDILGDLTAKILQYDELLIKSRELVSFQRPTKRDYQSVRYWFHNVAPLVDEEQEYITWKEDIITLRHGREWAGFDGLVEECLHKVNCRLIRWLFCTDDQKRKSSDKRIYYFSPSRVAKLVNLLITAVIFSLLAAPVLGMYRLSNFKKTEAIFAAIGVLMVFTLLFAAAMSLLTKARRHELFAASAAYCAVLVVFIGSTNFA